MIVFFKKKKKPPQKQFFFAIARYGNLKKENLPLATPDAVNPRAFNPPTTIAGAKTRPPAVSRPAPATVATVAAIGWSSRKLCIAVGRPSIQ